MRVEGEMTVSAVSLSLSWQCALCHATSTRRLHHRGLLLQSQLSHPNHITLAQTVVRQMWRLDNFHLQLHTATK